MFALREWRCGWSGKIRKEEKRKEKLKSGKKGRAGRKEKPSQRLWNKGSLLDNPTSPY